MQLRYFYIFEKKSRALSHGLPYNISTMDYGALCCACFHIYQGLTARGSIHSFWDILDILPMFCLRSRVELLFLIYFIYLILYLFFVGWIVFHFIWVIGPEHGWVDNRMYGYGYPGKAINQKGLKFFFFFFCSFSLTLNSLIFHTACLLDLLIYESEIISFSRLSFCSFFPSIIPLRVLV